MKQNYEAVSLDEYVGKYLRRLVGRLTELYNGADSTQARHLLYKQMLSGEYTSDLRWDAASIDSGSVAADVVALDAEIPLRRRSPLTRASGAVTKVAIGRAIDEKTLSAISSMAAKGVDEAAIARRLLDNVPRVVGGVHARLEILFEQALSIGQCLVADEGHEGLGVRVDYGYKKENMFDGSGWGDPDVATPVSDLRKMFSLADANGDKIGIVMMSEQYAALAKKSREVIELVASHRGRAYTGTGAFSEPTTRMALDALSTEFGADFETVSGSFRVETRSGAEITVRPWVQDSVVGLRSRMVGRLMHATPVEWTHRAAGTRYEASGDIIVSHTMVNEPSLSMITRAQELALPVIDSGRSVYVIHADGGGEGGDGVIFFAADGMFLTRDGNVIYVKE